MQDDALVDAAAAANLETARTRLDQRLLKSKIAEFYSTVADAVRKRRAQ